MLQFATERIDFAELLLTLSLLFEHLFHLHARENYVRLNGVAEREQEEPEERKQEEPEEQEVEEADEKEEDARSETHVSL